MRLTETARLLSELTSACLKSAGDAEGGLFSAADVPRNCITSFTCYIILLQSDTHSACSHMQTHMPGVKLGPPWMFFSQTLLLQQFPRLLLSIFENHLGFFRFCSFVEFFLHKNPNEEKRMVYIFKDVEMQQLATEIQLKLSAVYL